MSQSTDQQTNNDIFQQFNQQPYYLNLLQLLEAERMIEIEKDLQCYTGNLKSLHDPTYELQKRLDQLKEKQGSKQFESSCSPVIACIKNKAELFERELKLYRQTLSRSKNDVQKLLQKQEEKVVRTKDLAIKVEAQRQMNEKRIKIQNLIAMFSMQVRKRQIGLSDIVDEIKGIQQKIIRMRISAMSLSDKKKQVIKPIQFKTSAGGWANVRKQEEKDSQQIRMLKGLAQH